MYEIIKSVICAGGFKLAEIQHKVKKLYILGDITGEQLDELLGLIAQNLSADAERPEVTAMVSTLSAKVADLETKVVDLEAEIAALKGEGSSGDTAGGYPVWKPWDGLPTSGYDYGQIVQHPITGALWQSKYTGGKNTWEPGVLGTELVWVPYTPEEE